MDKKCPQAHGWRGFQFLPTFLALGKMGKKWGERPVRARFRTIPGDGPTLNPANMRTSYARFCDYALDYVKCVKKRLAESRIYAIIAYIAYYVKSA